MIRRLLSICLAAAGHVTAASPEATPLASARANAEKVIPLVMAAIWPANTARSPALAEHNSLGAILAHYAANPAGDPERESFAEAARRILAGGATTKHTPDETVFLLDELAEKIRATADVVEIEARHSVGVAPGSELSELRARAHLARFHSRRIVAAMHYNLFLRGLRLAELVAATYAEKEAVAAWRALAALPAKPEIAGARRAELARLERSLKELEEQCCPPDEAILKEKVWQPGRETSR